LRREIFKALVAIVVFADPERVKKKLKTVYHTLGASSKKSGINDSSCVSGGRYGWNGAAILYYGYAWKVTTSHEGGFRKRIAPGTAILGHL
jgi:hypothetical protein